jgi:hypothetical protein
MDARQRNIANPGESGKTGTAEKSSCITLETLFFEKAEHFGPRPKQREEVPKKDTQPFPLSTLTPTLFPTCCR